MAVETFSSNDKAKQMRSSTQRASTCEAHDPQADTISETRRGPRPLPKSSSTVCSARATPRTSGSFTFSNVALQACGNQIGGSMQSECPGLWQTISSLWSHDCLAFRAVAVRVQGSRRTLCDGSLRPQDLLHKGI